MSDEEALAILNVTEKSSRWLLLHLRPDKHPHHEAQAEAALSRVNQARDVRCRHVTDWTQLGLRCVPLSPLHMGIHMGSREGVWQLF